MKRSRAGLHPSFPLAVALCVLCFKGHESDAAAMARYMKTSMPFYGLKKPLQVPVLREMKVRDGNRR